MKSEDMPAECRKWIDELKHGDPCIEDHVNDLIYTALDINDLKKDIIFKMSAIMAECTCIIQHANKM